MRIVPIPISAKQKLFRESTKWLTGLCGGRGSGKTKVGSIHISQIAKPDDPWMVISPDNNVIRETTFPTFLETVQRTGQYVDAKLSPIPRIVFRTRWGKTANVVFKGAEVPDKIRGPNKAGIWFDEASVITKEAFDVAIACCRWHGKMGPVLATFTPRGFKHWSFESFYDRVDDLDVGTKGYLPEQLESFQGRWYKPKPDTFLVRCSTRDNPFAPPEFADRISQNYSTALALQEIEGDFVEISGLIFKREWFLNVVRHAPANATRVRYVDKASSADSGCYTVGLLMARDDRGIYYIEEMIRGQWSAHVRNQMLLEMCRKDSIKYGGTVLTYIEQEGGGDGKTVSEQLITMLSQFPVYRDVVSGGQWKKKGNERLPGDAKVRRALPFAAQCEAGNVRLVEGSFHGDFLDEVTMFPEYAYADIVDACVIAGTQIATENGSKPIENVLPGDRVLTRGGFKEVLWSGQTGVSVDTVLIECHNGSVLQLTGNHPVYVVGKKWVQASRINAGDRVLVSTRRKSSRSTDTASGDTRSIIESTYKTTSGGESMERQKASIGTRGKRITGQFPTGTRCTTLTAIHSTTQSTILSACRCPSTQRSTRGEAILSGQNRTLKEFDHSRRSGTDHQRVANGIASMPHELSRTEKQQRKHAQRAARRLSPCTPTLSAVQRFALTGSESIPTAQSAIVTFARTATKRLTQERRSRSIAVAHVVRVRFMQHGEPVNVFNLSVSECEEYFANGILVHNCSGAYNALQRLAPTYGDVAQRSTEPMPKSRFGQTAHLGEGNSISQWSELPWNQNTEPTDELMGR